ncbi:MAG TPA: hypothetical protein VFQ36_15945 [Ktedonobacteraceae bacterium]|nr:hypothetical protein [Ktedonobacteraceae bacterium]
MTHRPARELPTVPVGLNDLAALRSIISGYLVVLRRTAAQSLQRQTQVYLLEGVYQRLTGISAQALEARIYLSVPEVEALNTALLDFAAFVRQKVPSSAERDETLQALELLRQQLLKML